MYPWDVGDAPYVRPGLSPWYDTTDIVVPQKSCRLLLAPMSEKRARVFFALDSSTLVTKDLHLPPPAPHSPTLRSTRLS